MYHDIISDQEKMLSRKIKRDSFSPMRDYSSFVLNDDQKYIIGGPTEALDKIDKEKDNLPGLNYDFFLEHGFKIKAIMLPVVNREFEINKVLTPDLQDMLNLPDFTASHRIQEDLLGEVKLLGASNREQNAWLSTKILVTKRYTVSPLWHGIRDINDLKSIQDALIAEKVIRWMMIDAIVLEHLDSGREICNHLLKTKGPSNKELDQLYITYIETLNDNTMSQIDNFNSVDLDWVYDGFIYTCECDREIVQKSAIRQRCKIHH